MLSTADQNEDSVQASSELSKIHQQLFSLFNSSRNSDFYFPVEKVNSASVFIVSQREVLSRLRKKALTIRIHNEHPSTRFLSFHDASSFRLATYDLRKEFEDFVKQMRALNRMCSAVDLSEDQFDLYSLNVYATPKKNIGLPFRNWKIGDYLTITPVKSGIYYIPHQSKKIPETKKDIFANCYVIENGIGDLLSIFADFGKLSTMIRGNLVHRVLEIYKKRLACKDSPTINNIKKIEPILYFLVPVLIEYSKMMIDVRHAVISNKAWKQPKFIY